MLDEYPQDQRSREHTVPDGGSCRRNRLGAAHPLEALFRRGDESASLFRGLLEQKLLALNPWLRPDQARSIVETFDALSASIEGNRERLAWLRGERSWFDEQEKRHRRVHLIDFAHVDANAFHVTWE